MAVTAFAMHADHARAAAAGFDGYVEKPISVRALPGQVQRFLEAGHVSRPWPTPSTVLAVDDQPQNLRLLDAVLSPRGYRVLPGVAGEEALDLLADATTSTWSCSTS